MDIGKLQSTARAARRAASQTQERHKEAAQKADGADKRAREAKAALKRARKASKKAARTAREAKKEARKLKKALSKAVAHAAKLEGKIEKARQRTPTGAGGEAPRSPARAAVKSRKPAVPDARPRRGKPSRTRVPLRPAEPAAAMAPGDTFDLSEKDLAEA